MLRLFPEHRIRPTVSLDGLWRFRAIPAGDSATLPRANDEPILVPSCWEMLPGWESWRGQALIAREVETLAGRGVRLVFGGVSHTAEVFWDGEPIGDHYDAFTPFEVLHWPKTDGPSNLAVKVDNTFGEHSALHISNDYYTYGGITRPVVMEYVPPVHLARLRATPVRTGAGTWQLDLHIIIRSHGSNLPPQDCVIALDGKTIWQQRFNPEGEHIELHAIIDVAGVEPWMQDHPRLYELAAELHDADGMPTDDLIDRMGFREVRVSGESILLNGEPLHLRGYNRHEDHAIFGCALPLQAMAHDLALLRDLGANFVRTSHYPNDLRFLDLCDETGMLVWEESHARQLKFEHPRYAGQMVEATREMLEWHHNHPCIFLWGCLNECDAMSDTGVKHHEEILNLIKATDRSRPVTYAGHFKKNDRCMGLADVISHNFYTGWYVGTPDDTASVIEDFLSWVDSPASLGGAGKPFILSEFGAGAIAGFHAPPLVRLTEEYQAEVLQKGIEVYGGHPRIAGLCLWQFSDCRVSEEGEWWQCRPRNQNDKGTVDRNRNRKLAYGVVKAAFARLKPPNWSQTS